MRASDTLGSWRASSDRQCDSCVSSEKVRQPEVVHPRRNFSANLRDTTGKKSISAAIIWVHCSSRGVWKVCHFVGERASRLPFFCGCSVIYPISNMGYETSLLPVQVTVLEYSLYLHNSTELAHAAHLGPGMGNRLAQSQRLATA